MPSARKEESDTQIALLPPFEPLGNNVQPLHSLPPSPTEEDLGGRTLWDASSDDDDIKRNSIASKAAVSSPKKARKGKGKAIQTDLEAGIPVAEEELTPRVGEFRSSYPPPNDEDAEARKVEENLKRWEEKERERRRIARESQTSYSTGIFDGLTRRTSLLWRGKGKHSQQSSMGRHKSLVTSEAEADQSVGLDDIVTPSVSTRPRSYMHPDLSDRTMKPHVDNPFEPPDVSASLQSSSLMIPSSKPPTPAVNRLRNPFSDPTERRPVLQASNSFTQRAPAPRPLDVPPPRSPPPRPSTAAATRPPEPHPRPVIDYGGVEEPDEPMPEVKWWHEWLCGWGEGPDRGGDHQAGRTNPFE